MTSLAALSHYADSDSGDEEDSDEEVASSSSTGTQPQEKITADHTAHLQQLPQGKSMEDLRKTVALNTTPDVAHKDAVEYQIVKHIDPTTKELSYNPTYDELYAPVIGPANPYKTQQQAAAKNMWSGFTEPSNFNAFEFENQRRTFHSYGYAVNPDVDNVSGSEVIGDKKAFDAAKGATVFETMPARPKDKRKREDRGDPGELDGYLGPWAKFADEQTTMKPPEDDKKFFEDVMMKRAKKKKRFVEEKIKEEEKTIMHLKDPLDYQGRSFMHVPQDIEGVNLRSDFPPERCFLPKKQIHQWEGHTKGVQTIKLFPKFGHLLLSGSMDSKIKLWQMYGDRKCIRTYLGHTEAVRDLCFTNDGTKFLSASYDRYVKLWDTETGKVIQKFTSKMVPFCVKFHPEEDKQHLFLAGMGRKILCWDTNTGETTQEYNRHMAPVNTITFIDQNRRFVSTADDKSLRLWEWDIPVDFRYISDPTMHSMPKTTLSPNGKWLACQSMDNQIVIFNILNRFKMMKKKNFKAHMVAGYACGLDFSPDMTYIVSGDADGKVYVWHWRTVKLYHKFQAHDGVCIDLLWHPHETSKLITCGWDGLIKLWD